ncbi:Uncharacterized iron-regulated membrane protein [Salinimicrobium catena]|uniref:Uncharacterized iron-regulated membrane protein n=1 Tax=Salinimicrobium catena TaxID=390640 RepID=A0A1H5MUC7_9FLAO|nr:PepSY-associated TM helix domain-containing protein [Salinimicrobium catena]SDL29947.1 Uncharacterized iron-regulated membrane protein [Salinimicrobium catena]SEE92969.1 Uncharacterized iron-regulated membrane protein [Salinimicrobium catena]
MKKRKPSVAFKELIRQAHLYLGLVSGLVVFIVSVTGCLWAFQEEINKFTSTLPTIEKQNLPVILPSEAKELAHEVFPGRLIHGTLYEAQNDPIKVIFYELEPEFYQTVYLHPYSGEVLEIDNNLKGFFPFVLEGHRYLWMPKFIGEQVVAWSTVIFAFMLISGIVLWWPKKRKQRKQKFSFDWKKSTRWKRKNYDLHSVVGFYVSFVAIIVIYTGLVMAFDSFGAAVYYGLGGEKEALWRLSKNYENSSRIAGKLEPIDQLYYDLREEYPQANDLEFHYPYASSDAIYVEIGYQDGVYYDADYRFYDNKSLQEISSPTLYGKYEEAGFPEKVLRMNYDIHVGAIGGIPGKVLAFFISLLCASLPITGFLLWYGRTIKKKKVISKPILAYQE